MKLIILGLDALNHEIIEKCKEDMPTLYSHVKEDCAGMLRTTIPYFTGPTWTSLQTGKKISNHGIVNFFKYDDDLNLRLFTGNDIKEKTFYELIDENGLKSFIMNLPYSYPAKIKGDLIFSWLHVYDNIEELFHPASLIERYPSLKQYKNRADRSKSVSRYLNTGYDVLLSQEKVVKELVEADDHDVCFFLLNAADMVQHKVFGELMDGKDNRKTKIARKMLGRLDELIKWIDENKGDAVVLIASDHGFQMYDGKFFLNSWLKNNGYLFTSEKGKEIKDTINIFNPKKKGTVNISRLVTFVKKHPRLFKLSESFYDFFVHYLPFDIVKQPKIDFEKTKAYCRSLFEGIIFFNKDISSGERVELKKELLEKLNKIEDIEAHDCDEFYAGKYRDEMGDIVVVSRKFEIDNNISGNEFMHLKRPMHSLDGIFMVYGGGIKKNCSVKGAKIFDVMPTLLHILGISVPADMDGKVLKEIFEEDSVFSKRNVSFSSDSEKENIKSAIGNLRF